MHFIERSGDRQWQRLHLRLAEIRSPVIGKVGNQTPLSIRVVRSCGKTTIGQASVCYGVFHIRFAESTIGQGVGYGLLKLAGRRKKSEKVMW